MKRVKWMSVILCVLLGIAGLFAAGCGDRKSNDEYVLTLNKATLTLTVGDTSTLTAKITKGGESVTATVVWRSSDESVVTAENGKITARKAGTATVTASYEGANASCSVVVRESAITLSLNRTEITLYEGEEETLTVTASDGKTYDCAWESLDPTVATVENGKVTAVKEGSTVVKASYGNATANCTVTVEKEEVFLLLSKSNVNLKVHEEETVTASTTDGSSVTVNWTSDDPTVATVENGKITAIKAGTTKIKADAGADLTAECNVTVSDDFMLIFPEIVENLFVGETYDLQIIVRKNGTDEDISQATVTGDGFTRDGTVITPIRDGEIAITVNYNGVKLIRTAAVYRKITNKTELENVGNNLAGKYMLTQDIDMQGGNFNTIGHYNVGDAGEKPFTGILDGNGHSIMNFTPVRGDTQTAASNSALIGSVGVGGIVRNLSVINVTLNGRIGGGIASTCKGTIENCFVDVTVNYAASGDYNNPMGGVAAKVYNTSDIRNVIAVVRIGSAVAEADLVTVGAFAGFYVSTGKYDNCYSISPASLGFTETSAAVNTVNAVTNKAAPAGCADFNSIAAFNDAVDGAGFTGWTFVDGLYPRFTGMPAEQIAFTCEDSMYANTTLAVTYTSKYNAVELSLDGSYADVTLENGVLTVGADAEAGTVVVHAKSLYFGTTEQIEITVSANAYTIDIAETQYELTWVKDGAAVVRGENAVTLTFTVRQNGTAYEGEVTVESKNTDVITVTGNTLTAVADGTATVEIGANGVPLATLTVVSNMYNAVKTKEEFLAIGSNYEHGSMAEKYMLMNDIDFGNTEIKAFSSYNMTSYGNHGTDIRFTGVFDGDGHTLSNFTTTYNNTHWASDRDRSVFGYMDGAIVRNVTFLGVKAADRTSVVSSYMANRSLVENVFVELQIVKASGDNVNDNNPAGGIVGKISSDCTVRNSFIILAVDGNVTFKRHGTTGVTLFGAVASQNNGGTISNCQVLYKDTAVNVYSVSTGTVTGSAAYASLSALYAADLSGYDSAVWAIAEGYLPHLTGMAREAVNYTCANEVYAGNTLNITYTSKYAVELSLNDSYADVTLENGVLTVGADAEADAQIVINAKSLYFAYNEQFTVTVKANAYTIDIAETQYELTWVKDGAAVVRGENAVTLTFTVRQNGTAYEGEVTVESKNTDVITVTGNTLTAVADGTATVEIGANGVPLATLTVVSNMYNAVKTKEEFLAIGTDKTSMSKKYMLMNDIDFGGATIHAFSAWATKSTVTFTGVFDGDGHTISDFVSAPTAKVSGNSDCGVFGYMDGGAIVRNVSFVKVKSSARSAVIANWIQNGAVENVYVELDYTAVNNSTASSSNPAGGIVGKVQANGTVKNSVIKLTRSASTTPVNFGAVASLNNGGKLMNCYVIADETFKISNSGNGTATDCAVLTTEQALAKTDWQGLNGSLWTVTAKCLPHLTGMAAEEITFTCADTVFVGNTLNVTYTSKYAVTLSLNDTYTGVSLAGNVLTVNNTATAGAEIEVVAKSLYFGTREIYKITLAANAYAIVMDKTNYAFTWVKDYSAAVDYTETLTFTVTQNGAAYDGEITFTSSNEGVATVTDGVLTVTGDGKADITLSTGGVDLKTIAVTSDMYVAIADKTDLETLATAKSADATLAGKYMLVNDIDVGGNLNTIAHYNAGCTGIDNGFRGVFDGNGHTISNFTPAYGGAITNNASFIGTLSQKGIIRNLRLTGVTIGGASAGRIAGGITTMCYGTIENCYVEVAINLGYYSSTDNNNPIAGVAAKCFNVSKVRNVIAVVTFGDGYNASACGNTTGAFFGWYNASGSNAVYENLYSISPELIGFTEKSKSSNGTAEGNAPAGCADYDTTDAFFEGANIGAFDTKIWAFDKTEKTIALRTNVHNITKKQ